MIVCSCNALTHHDIKYAVDQGASRPAEVYAVKGCRAQCGGCVQGVVCALRALLDEYTSMPRQPISGREAALAA